MEKIIITRADGRSNTEVLLGLMAEAPAGQTFTYEELAAALAVGSTRVWDRKAVQSAVRSAAPKLLKQSARAVYAVKDVGYRLSRGSEHHGLALRREGRASTQLKHAVAVLRHVNFGEMTASERTVHEAHLTITGALFTQMRRVTQKQKQQDEAIASLLSRVDKLEEKSGG